MIISYYQINMQNLKNLDEEITKQLLICRTLNTDGDGKQAKKILLKNHIKFANNNWDTFQDYHPITVDFVTGYELTEGKKIQSRSQKQKTEQKLRTKSKAEVFTPLNIVKQQNDMLDREICLDILSDDVYQQASLEDLKNFIIENSAQEYFAKTHLEVACGEAPYITTRYHMETGEAIALELRQGFLDRKLQVLKCLNLSPKKYLELVKVIYKSCYGFEFQGDSLFLARKNLLSTFIENYQAVFNETPDAKQQKAITTIISYNIFQMDGLTLNLPNSHIPAKIKDWQADKMIEFKSLKSGEN